MSRLERLTATAAFVALFCIRAPSSATAGFLDLENRGGGYFSPAASRLC